MNLAKIADSACGACLSVRDPGEMKEQDQQLLRNAIQTGFGQYFAVVPDRYKKKVYTARFGAAVSGTASVTADSDVVTFSGVTPIEGATVIIAGDDVVNQVYLTSGGAYRLILPYGGTTGSKVATVYRDTAILPWTYAAITCDPYDMRAAGPGLPVVEDGSLWPGEWSSWQAWAGRVMTGYRFERSGEYTVMRIIPPPSGDFPLRMEGIIENLQISAYGDIGSITDASAAAVPVTDDHCTRMVLPLIGDALITHPLFRSPNLERSIKEAAERARADMRLLRSRADAGPNRLIHQIP